MNMPTLIPQEGSQGAPSTSQPPAGTEGGEAPREQGSTFTMLFPMLMIFVIFYFLLLRPQRKQAKERDAMIAALKKDDHVLTNGGIYGIVKQVRESSGDVILTIDERQDVRVRVARSAIAQVSKVSGPETEAKAEEKAKS